MKNYYLKTTDADTLWSVLESLNLAEKVYDPEDENNQRPVSDNLEEEIEWSPSGRFDWVEKKCNLDVIGTIYQKTGNMLTDSEGNEYPEMQAIEGFHANLKANLDEDQEAALPLISAPATPYRKWAGE